MTHTHKPNEPHDNPENNTPVTVGGVECIYVTYDSVACAAAGQLATDLGLAANDNPCGLCPADRTPLCQATPCAGAYILPVEYIDILKLRGVKGLP